MNVTKKLKMDLTKPDVSLSVNAVQGDAYSRSLYISLYSGFHPWMIPEGTKIAIRYAKPDHTKGYYDTLPDGTSAWSSQGNILSIQLAPQMLTVAGNVQAQIELIKGTHILSTFPLTVIVQANPAVGVLQSEDYTNWLQWIQDQSEAQVLQVQQSAQAAKQSALNASQAAHTAAGSAESAAAASGNAASSAANANLAAGQALDAVASAAAIREETKAIAAEVSAIVAGNEAYTKQESDCRYSSAILQKATGETILVADALGTAIRSLKLYGKTIQHGIPTADTPAELISAGNDGNILIQLLGKNLFYIPVGQTNTQRGVTLTVLEDGCIQIQGTKTESAEATIYYEQIPAAPYAGKTVTVRSDKANVRVQCNVKLKDGTKRYHSAKNGLSTFTIPENAEIIGWQISVDGTGSYDNIMVHPYAVLGKQLGKWEPYIAPQVLTLSTPNGLSGIPVVSGGNYTDENGQQWICDEINLDTGTHTQRIGHISSYNADMVGSVYLSNTGVLTSGAYVLYPLTEPVVIPIPADELAVYSALHINSPNSTILTDSGTGMEVSYMADTKLYVDNKFTQLAAALINND